MLRTARSHAAPPRPCPVEGCRQHARLEAVPLCPSCWSSVSRETRAQVRRAFARGRSFTYAGVAMPTGEWSAAVWLATFEAEAARRRQRCTA